MKKKFIPIIALLTIAVVSCTENILPTEVVMPEAKCENRALEEIVQIAKMHPRYFKVRMRQEVQETLKRKLTFQVSQALQTKT